MQQKKTFQSRFTRKTESGNNLTHSKPIPAAIPSSKCFRSITELPLSKFIEVAVDENYAALIVSGMPDIGVLQDAWYEIYQQYLDAMGDSEQLMILKLYREITRLVIEQDQIQMLIDFLSIYNYKAYNDRLNALLQTKFQFKEKKKDDLQRAARIARQMTLKLDIKQSQLVRIQEKMPKEGVKISREYFQSILITLSDFSKYPIHDNISTYEFCERVKRFTSFVQAQKQKK